MSIEDILKRILFRTEEKGILSTKRWRYIIGFVRYIHILFIATRQYLSGKSFSDNRRIKRI